MTRDLKRLEEVLEIFGPEPRRWPEAERNVLEALSREAPGGRRLLAEARALDQVMARAPGGEASDRAKRQVMEAIGADTRLERAAPSFIERLRQRLEGGWLRAPAWSPAAVMSAALALGVYLGASGLTQPVLDQAVQLAAMDGGVEEAESLFGGDEAELLNEEGQL